MLFLFFSIPEIPKDTKETNPIMDYESYPQFSKLDKDNVVRGCAKLALTFDVEFDKLAEKLGKYQWTKKLFTSLWPVAPILLLCYDLQLKHSMYHIPLRRLERDMKFLQS